MVQTQIMVVEDEGIVGLEIQNRLANMGYRVTEIIATGEGAIKKAAAAAPDLVLMDIRLKGRLDGVDAAERIRNTLNIPVIFLTAYADEDTLQRARISEPYGYVLKPFDERELRIAIEMALYKHQMERKLKEHERWLATTLDSISDAIITTDEQGLVNFLNPVAEILTGWSQAQASGRRVAEVFMIVDEATNLIVDDLINLVVAQGRLDSSMPDPLLITRMNSELPIQFRAAPIRNQTGNVMGVVLVFRDMTQQRKVEQELLRAHKLESLGLLAGGVAHDFNNLLSAIVNNIGLMKMQVKPSDDVYKRLEYVEKAAWRGTDLTQQLLTFARGGAPVKRTAFIQTILHEAADLTLSGSSVKLIDAIANDLWPVEVDTTQMSQALQSVFSNAKEAMPNGGPLLVRAENVQVATEQNVALKPGKYIKITIQDHGVGIPFDNLAKIFDPYFSTKPHNSGLGLTTAYSIVTRHDGHITVESELKVGATFYIYLPASENAIAESTHDMDPTKPTAGKGRVLIMDDEELIREATGALLEFLGYDFQAAKDGAEAITLYRAALAAGQRFDIVILDLTVPGGMGGHESLKQLLAIDPHVKAIVSSGYFHDPVIANYRAHGFQGVVSKPYTIEELSDTLYKLIYLDA